ncbi:MAG: hypothetical protein Tsb0020_11420 [Haliangiales bacterium]
MNHALVPPAVPPPGTRYLPDWYVERPFEEQRALAYLAFGDPVLLWGPRDQGCTWLSQHLVRAWKQLGPFHGSPERDYIVIDFRSLGALALESLDACLSAIAEVIDDALPESHARTPMAERWALMRGDAKIKLTSVVRRLALPAMPGELLLAFDHADLVHRRPYYEDLAGLLRSWAEKSKSRTPWDRLRLLVSASIHPALLRTARHESPFVNLSDPIRVGDLEPDQVSDLVRRHGLNWTRADVARLMQLVGGHPYLVRAIVEDIRAGRYRLADLDHLDDAHPIGRSLIDEYLQRDRTRLEASSELGHAFTQLVEDPAAEVACDAVDELIRLGLVTQGPGGIYPVRYRLFKRLRYTRNAPPKTRKRRLFYSYAQADEARRDRLELHLSLLEQQGLIASWHNRKVAPGQVIRDDVDHHLQRADIILLLISADFLASSYCGSSETQQAIKRHQAGDARVIPIILRSCDWHSAPFGSLQPLPKDGLPVSRWTDEDDAWADVAQAVRHLITDDSAP